MSSAKYFSRDKNLLYEERNFRLDFSNGIGYPEGWMIPPTRIGFRAICLFIFLSGTLFADDFKTNDGKEYKNVTVSRAEPDGIVVMTSYGIIKLYFVELPQDVRDKYHYDPAQAAKFEAQIRASQQGSNNQAVELQRKQAEEDSKRREEEDAKWFGEPGHKFWISGEVVGKGPDGALLIQCSGESQMGYHGLQGRIVLRDHPRAAMLAQGDHVEMLGTTIPATRWGDHDPWLHAFQATPH
jgi:hypothetical protein